MKKIPKREYTTEFKEQAVKHVKTGKSIGAVLDKAEPKKSLPAKQVKRNRKLSSVRAKVEHPFRVVKRQFGYMKVRYKGLVKNTAQVFTLFDLASLYMA